MDIQIITALLVADLRIREAHSLKEKRSVVKSLKEKCRSRFSVSISELGSIELKQRLVMVFGLVGNKPGRLYSELDRLQSTIESQLLGRAEILKLTKSLLEGPTLYL